MLIPSTYCSCNVYCICQGQSVTCDGKTSSTNNPPYPFVPVRTGEFITAQQIKNLQNAINREEKRRNVRIEQSGTYPNQSGVSGGGTKRWVIDKLVTTGSMTSFEDVSPGSYIKSSHFTAMKNAIKNLTTKTMDFNLNGSELNSIDTNTGAIIYAKDMNAMANLISQMGKYCVCNNKEACNCKEACNSNCSCQGHCTCNSYDPCGCNGYVPCECYGPCNSQCSCKSDTCSCQGKSSCGCDTYVTNKEYHRVVYVKDSYNGATTVHERSGFLVFFFKPSPTVKNGKIKSANIYFDTTYTSSIGGPIPTQSYIDSIANESTWSVFLLRNFMIEYRGSNYYLDNSYNVKPGHGIKRDAWSYRIIKNGDSTYDPDTGTSITYHGPNVRRASKSISSMVGVPFDFTSSFRLRFIVGPFANVVFMPPFHVSETQNYFKNPNQYRQCNIILDLIVSYQQ